MKTIRMRYDWIDLIHGRSQSTGTASPVTLIIVERMLECLNRTSIISLRPEALSQTPRGSIFWPEFESSAVTNCDKL